MRTLCLSSLCVLVLACTSGGNTSGSGGAVASGGAAGVAGTGAGGAGGQGGGTPTCAGSGFAHRPMAIATCDGLAPGSEDCHYRLVYDQAQCCPEAPCDRLLVFWAGGNQTCDDGEAFDPILEGYADHGFVTACAQPYTSEQEGGRHPYHTEVARMQRVMEAVRSDVGALWTGDKLLVGGTSHGGTAPLVVIASTDAFDARPDVWTGATHTAVMLNDGISNPRTLEEWTGATSGCGLFHQRFVGRYHGGTGPLLHSCNNGQCYCAGLSDVSDWEKDTVVIGAQDPTSPYACADFEQTGKIIPYRFAACSGGTAQPCGLLGDIIPDAQQEEAYKALSTCSGVDATYQHYPNCSHIACGGWNGCGAQDSLNWLAGLGW